MFLKASLVGQTCQSLAAKSFTSKFKSWMSYWCTPALDQRSMEACFSHRTPCPCKRQAVSAVVHAISHSILCLPFHGSQPLTCSSKTAERLQWCHCCGPAASHLGPRRPSRPHHISNLPAQPPQQHPKTCRGIGDPSLVADSAVLPRAALRWVRLPSSVWLLRAAYVLTGRNTGKQLAPSEPPVPCQESTQVPVPPFPGQHIHFQMCSTGVKFKLLSGTFINILFSQCYTLLWSHPYATGHTWHFGKCPAGSALVCLQVCLLLYIKYELTQPDHH